MIEPKHGKCTIECLNNQPRPLRRALTKGDYMEEKWKYIHTRQMIESQESEETFKHMRTATDKNNNLIAIAWYLDKDFAGFKKGYIYRIIDMVTGRQTNQNWQTLAEAWEYVAVIDESYPEYLAKP